MTDLFAEYLKISLCMIPVIAAAIWLLPKAAGKYRASLPYAVYLIIALRLLMPLNITVPSNAVQYQPEVIFSALTAEEKGDTAKAAADMKTETAQSRYLAAEKQSIKKQPISAVQILCILWLTVGTVLALWYAASAIRLSGELKSRADEPSDRVKNVYKRTAGDRKAPSLSVCDVTDSPMVAGIIKPCIYIPHEDYTEAELEMIFRHELIHCRRKDLLYKLLLIAVKCVHWFNPFVWIMTKKAQEYLEVYCDAETVCGTDRGYRIAYADMILKETERSVKMRNGLTTGFSAGKKNLKKRLAEIVNIDEKKRGLHFLVLALVLTVTAGTGVRNVSAEENITVPAEEVQKMAETWAEALMTRNGKPRCDMMNERLRKEFEAEQTDENGEILYSIGWSSPWAESYEIGTGDNKAYIVYSLTDSTQTEYRMIEILKFGGEKGRTVVTEDICSDLYTFDTADGELKNFNPSASVSGIDIDENIWTYLRQTAADTITVYRKEITDFDFNINSLKRTFTSGGKQIVTLGFTLDITYRNPFDDPDEIDYIKQAKADNSSDYEKLYRDYNEPKVYTLDDLVFECSVDINGNVSEGTAALYMADEKGEKPLLNDIITIDDSIIIG
ncbi:MAG: M56 family metallopeptidase [Clostridia bacterium]|nr:M56 family metallopeptidase [Clostridia bacterium]